MIAPPTLGDVRDVVGDVDSDRPLRPSFQGARISAVLVALADGSHDLEGASVLLTRRSALVSSHRGQVAFPGGRVDDGETPIEAALREAHEEVGLDPALIEPFGELTHLNTEVSNSYIVPIVAAVESAAPLAPASVEVDRVFWAPLADFLRPGVHTSQVWERDGRARRVHFYDVAGENVWGATAAVLTELLDLLRS